MSKMILRFVVVAQAVTGFLLIAFSFTATGDERVSTAAELAFFGTTNLACAVAVLIVHAREIGLE